MNDKLGRYLEEQRIKKVLPYIKGKLLDIGCGNNKLTKSYAGQGIGVDVFDWGNVDYIVEDTSKIDFKNCSFDTVTIIAALNHIPNREDVIEECYRLLSSNGSLIITMIPPRISTVWHFLRRPWDVDQNERGMKEGEVYGLKRKEIIKMCENKGFKLKETSTFMSGMNRIYLFERQESK
jgi:2-polyprenyl-3-methyl-5-hydroxy-6-metoxy-1,4-benzoquinol methylase